MQSVPDHINLEAIQSELLKVRLPLYLSICLSISSSFYFHFYIFLSSLFYQLDGVANIHDLHVWQLSESKVIGTVHLTCHTNVDFLRLATAMKKVLHGQGIHATTFQPEFVDEPEKIELDTVCTYTCRCW